MITTIGFIGAFLFGICAFPQVYQVWKTQDTKSLSLSFLIIWALGEVFTWIYIVLQNIELEIIQWPLHMNYFLNSIGLTYLLYKKLSLKKLYI